MSKRHRDNGEVRRPTVTVQPTTYEPFTILPSGDIYTLEKGELIDAIYNRTRPIARRLKGASVAFLDPSFLVHEIAIDVDGAMTPLLLYGGPELATKMMEYASGDIVHIRYLGSKTDALFNRVYEWDVWGEIQS